MKGRKVLERIIEGFVLLSAVLFILIGFYYLPSKSFNYPVSTNPLDSTFTIENSTDTTNNTSVSISTSTKKEYKSSDSTTNCSEFYNYSLDYSYKFFTLGVGILLLLFLIPSLKDFNFLGLFSATFRERVETLKAEANVATQLLSEVPPPKDNMSKRKISQKDGVRAKESNMMPDSEIVVYENDIQKGKWGGLSENKERKLIALVTPYAGNPELFNIELKVISTNPKNVLRGKVTFHLHNTFANPNPSIFIVEGQAKLNLVAWGAFTVGAETDNGAVQLELDLAELPDAPLLFKSR